MTHRVLASLLMPTVRVLVPLVMQWWGVLLVMLALIVRMMRGMSPLTLLLVMTTVRVLQVMVPSVSPCIGGRRRFRAWALFVGWLAGPGNVGCLWCRHRSSTILAECAVGGGGVGDGFGDADVVCSCRCCTWLC